MSPRSRTTRDRHDLIHQHCLDLGLRVEWRRLPPGWRGFYRKSHDLIVIHDGLTRRQATACMAHEAGHAEFGDTCTTPANERRAWEFGASLIISARDYRKAEEIVGSHPNSLALELEVTPDLIKAWRRWWLRQGYGLDAAESA